MMHSKPNHNQQGVQDRMILVVNFFLILIYIFFFFVAMSDLAHDMEAINDLG